jgi:hypothetical protein
MEVSSLVQTAATAAASPDHPDRHLGVTFTLRPQIINLMLQSAQEQAVP